MGVPKFHVGDLARIGGRGRPLPACYPWLKRGRVVQISTVLYKENGNYLKGQHHLMYTFASRRSRPEVKLASFDLRRVTERDRAPGSGRRAAVRG